MGYYKGMSIPHRKTMIVETLAETIDLCEKTAKKLENHIDKVMDLEFDLKEVEKDE